MLYIIDDDDHTWCRHIIDDDRLPPEHNLSQVVKDSISVTKLLGYRYIWIDKHCINQHDAAIQKEQIENMDLVYTSAEVTNSYSGTQSRHWSSEIAHSPTTMSL